MEVPITSNFSDFVALSAANSPHDLVIGSDTTPDAGTTLAVPVSPKIRTVESDGATFLHLLQHLAATDSIPNQPGSAGTR